MISMSSTTSVAHTASPTTPTLERIEAELNRLRAARPELAHGISKAEDLLVTQLSAPAGVRPIKGRCNGHIHSYEVRSGSRLRKSYTVDRGAWTCDCPARKTCYHVIGCWVLERALSGGNPSGKGARCSGCGEKVPRRKLVEVGPEMAAFGHGAREGERYCKSCARHAGVL
jgi:hypothetical protein